MTKVFREKNLSTYTDQDSVISATDNYSQVTAQNECVQCQKPAQCTCVTEWSVIMSVPYVVAVCGQFGDVLFCVLEK